MNHSPAEPRPKIETWTKEDVHQWLMAEVKVNRSCADLFVEEDVSGEVLFAHQKKDILDLGVKHGPAVKITSYLEKMKTGSQHESEFPAGVKNWTKEQVAEWLLQHGKVDGRKAERFKEEDVSGDCLVCFGKQDFLDLELKKGPAVKILKELDQLKNKPEPTPCRVLPIGTAQNESLQKNLPPEKPPKQKKTPKEVEALTPQGKTKETAENPSVVIKTTLDKLGRNKLKSFKFHLRNYNKEGYNSVPQSKLEDKDTVDIATLLTAHYGCEDALQVTRDILKKINQRDLGSQLESTIGVKEIRASSTESEEETDESETPPRTNRKKRKKKKKRSCLCFINVKVHLPSCFDQSSLHCGGSQTLEGEELDLNSHSPKLFNNK